MGRHGGHPYENYGQLTMYGRLTRRSLRKLRTPHEAPLRNRIKPNDIGIFDFFMAYLYIMLMINSFILRRLCSFVLLVFFSINTMFSPCLLAQTTPTTPSLMTTSEVFSPTVLKGVIVDPQNPFKMDFIVEPSNIIHEKDLTSQITTLIKYFLTALTTPEDDMWVNLSAYEENRIIDEEFGQTIMGRDLLMQDFFLKQITASLLHPDTKTGKEFWRKIYATSYEKYGTTDIPIDTFNKVWISPDTARVYTNNNKAYILHCRMKVQLEKDFLAHEKESALVNNHDDDNLSQAILREVVLPVLEEEINERKTFAQLRQIYHSLILSAWFKRKMNKHLLKETFADQQKIEGLTYTASQKEFQTKEIWQQYVETFKKGIYNFIREEKDPLESNTSSPTTDSMVARKYFSGGFITDPAILDNAISFVSQDTEIASPSNQPLLARVDLIKLQSPKDAATKVDANDIRNFLFHIQQAFFTQSKHHGLLPDKESSRILDVRCILASHILAKVLSHQFNIPIGGNNPHRIDIIQGTFLPDESTHFWLALYTGEENPTLLIDGSYGQFNHLWQRTIIAEPYVNGLVRRKLKETQHLSEIEQRFLPAGSLEKATKVIKNLIKWTSVLETTVSDASEDNAYNKQQLSQSTLDPIDLFLNHVLMKDYPPKEKLISLAGYRDLHSFLEDTAISIRTAIMSSVLLENTSQEEADALRRQEGLKALRSRLLRQNAPHFRIAMMSDMFIFSRQAELSHEESLSARKFLWKLGEIDGQYFIKHASSFYGKDAFSLPLPVNPPVKGTDAFDQLPVLDIASGPRAGLFMGNQHLSSLVLVDRSYFVEALLHTLREHLHLEDRVEIHRLDITKNWKKILEGRLFRHVRLANIETYAGNFPQEFYADLSSSMPEGSTLSFEYPATAESRAQRDFGFERYVTEHGGWVLSEKKSVKGLDNEPLDVLIYTRTALNTQTAPDTQTAMDARTLFEKRHFKEDFDDASQDLKNTSEGLNANLIEVTRTTRFGNPYHLHNLPSKVISFLAHEFSSLNIQFFLQKKGKNKATMSSAMLLASLFVAYDESIEISALGPYQKEILNEAVDIMDRIIKDWQMQEGGVKENKRYDGYLNEIRTLKEKIESMTALGGIDMNPKALNFNEKEEDGAFFAPSSVSPNAFYLSGIDFNILEIKPIEDLRGVLK